jgi:hypothetical protein
MDAPTIREVMTGTQRCSEPWTSQPTPPCDYEREIDDHEKEQAVEDFIERVERIEKHLGLSEP